MPLDVIMPALGMAQDTGVIVTWFKKPGDAVTEGEALFEVETDKATMEVEAQGAGYLTDVAAAAGAAVPVGDVIARISETPEGTGPAGGAPAGAAETAAPGADTLPDGSQVIMPALGMAQDTGLIVAWHKEPGEAVAASDILFEVETDKSTMEVEAGHDGYVAALLAEAGEEAPVGAKIAVISADKPEAPLRRSVADGAAPKAPVPEPAAAPAPESDAAPDAAAAPRAVPAAPADPRGRVLASPKARRLAMERGLDLARLVEAGHPQPYHAKDLEALAALPEQRAPSATPAGATRHLTADVPADGFDRFARWAAHEIGLTDREALLAGLAAASAAQGTMTVAVEAFGATRLYQASGVRLGDVGQADEGAIADLTVRDLRFTRLASVLLGAEDVPVLSVMAAGEGLTLTLECAAGHLSAPAALTLLSNFAGRMEQPLRHLL